MVVEASESESASDSQCLGNLSSLAQTIYIMFTYIQLSRMLVEARCTKHLQWADVISLELHAQVLIHVKIIFAIAFCYVDSS